MWDLIETESLIKIYEHQCTIHERKSLHIVHSKDTLLIFLKPVEQQQVFVYSGKS